MEFHIDAPDEIKPKILQKIAQNGMLKSIKRKVKIGMMIAVEEIRNENQSDSVLERKIFKNANPYELKALQSIFNFLSANKMNYTLSTLLEESAVRRSTTDIINVMDLIDNEINRPEIPTNNFITNEDTRYYEEDLELKAKDKYRSEFNSKNNDLSDKSNLYDVESNNNDDGVKSNDDFKNNSNLSNKPIKFDHVPDFNSKNYNSHGINSISNNYTPNLIFENRANPTKEQIAKPNQELQGFSISRRTFERNQFVISVVNL